MWCANFILHAQVEQVAQQLAESEYQKFAERLPNDFANGKMDLLGNAKALKKQFLLEENAKVFADYLGWNGKKYSQRTLGTVYQALSKNAKEGKNNPNPVTVRFDFPAQPAETKVTIQNDKKGPNVERKATVVSYVATTKVDVQVEVGKGVESSIANNTITLVWDGRLRLVNGAVDETKEITPPKLRTIVFGSGKDTSEPVAEPPKASEEVRVEREVEPAPVEEPKQEPVTQPVSEPPTQIDSRPVSQPVRSITPSGREYYKVQILLLQQYVPLAELPERFRVENVIVERYFEGQNTYYKYVIPANNLNEAFAIRNRMNDRGILDAWIAVYEDGQRIRPYQGQPENVDR